MDGGKLYDDLAEVFTIFISILGVLEFSLGLNYFLASSVVLFRKQWEDFYYKYLFEEFSSCSAWPLSLFVIEISHTDEHISTKIRHC